MDIPADPLFSLRNAIRARFKISFTKDGESTTTLASATHIVLGPSVTLPKSAPTRLRKPGATSTNPTTDPSDFFTLDTVFLAWHLREAAPGEYMREARDSGLQSGVVSVTDRKAVVDWLEGRVATLANIVPYTGESTTPPGSPTPKSPGGAMHALPSGVTSTSPAKKRPYVVDSADSAVVKKIKLAEIELRDRNSVLRGIKPGNFSSVRAIYSETLKKMRDPVKGGAPAAASSAPDPKMLAKKQKNMHPIIMVSSSPTSLITMSNVKRFLEESVFETPQEARARMGKPNDMHAVYRKRTIIDSSGKESVTQLTYYVVDTAEALSKFGTDAWDRVVCVMTNGQEWQFKPYRWSEPKSLFHHVKGIYVCWASDPANPKIKDWNVTQLKIDPNRRHVDKSTVAEFWRVLDGWTMINKPGLVR